MPDLTSPLDNVEITSLLAQAEKARFGDYDHCIELAEKIMSLAQKGGDYTNFARGLYYQAWANHAMGRLEAALSASLEALKIARAYAFIETELDVINVIANSFLILYLDTEAEQLFKYAVELSRQITDPLYEAKITHDWSNMKYRQQDYEGTAILLEKCVEIIKNVECPDSITSIVYCSLAQSYSALGRQDDALRVMESLQEIAENTDDTLIICNNCFMMASIHIARGDIPLARYYADYPHLKNVQHTSTEVGMAALRAECARLEGRMSDAIEILETQYAKSMAAQTFINIVPMLGMLKEIYEKVGDAHGIIDVYKRLSLENTRHERQTTDMRIQILAMVFAQNKAMLQTHANISQQKYKILQRLSHEFRTPLTVIQSSAEMVDGYGEKMSLERRQKHLKNITSQVSSMTEMIENVAFLLQEPHDKNQYAPTVTALNTATYIAIARLEATGMDTTRINIKIRPEASTGLPKRIVVTIAYHLLHNALRYSQDDVDLELISNEESVIIRVSDKGIGIPVEEQKAVFEPLVRGSNQLEATGGGFGLAIVAKLISEADGHLSLTSDKDSGTVITIYLPHVLQIQLPV